MADTEEEAAIPPGVEDDQTQNQDEAAVIQQTDDEQKQRELIIFNAQKEGLVQNFQTLTNSIQAAQGTLVGESWARKLNATLAILEQHEADLKEVNREIKSYLTVHQLNEQFERDFHYQQKLQDFKQDVLMQQMEYYKEYPQSPSKPRTMIVIPTKVPVEDSKLVKLPAQELPVFTGDYSGWTSFLDSFEAMVGSKVNISEPAKLGYLKSALRGDPKALIMRLENNSSGNYARAMQILTERYQNQRAIIRTHLDCIINAPIVKPDNSTLLRKYIQCIEDNLEGLRQAGVATDNWGPILAYHVYQKLDNDTRRDFEVTFPGTEVQKVPELIKFLKERSAALETYSATGKKPQHEQPKPKPASGGAYAGQQLPPTSRISNVGTKLSCPRCQEDHSLATCPLYKAMTGEKRRFWTGKNKVCKNCLQQGHHTRHCSRANSCTVCHKQHHSLLHPFKPVDAATGKLGTGANHHVVQGNPNQPQPAAIPSSATVVPIQLQVTVTPVQQGGLPIQVTGATVLATPGPPHALHMTGTVSSDSQAQEDDEDVYTPLLGTAMVPVLNKEGDIIYGRALLDSGSQINFISDKFASELGLTKKAATCAIHTIGAVQPSATVGSVRSTLALPDGDRLPIRAHILSMVLGVLPTQTIDIVQDFSPTWDDLADSDFDKPGEIDLLIGCEIYEELMLGEKRKYGKLTATSSRIGWVITGTATIADESFDKGETALVPNVNAHVRLVDSEFITFRKVNDIKDTSVLAQSPSTNTTKERYVHKHFNDTTVIGDDGRTSVSLPFKESLPGAPTQVLGYSRGPAVRTQLSQEKKFATNPSFGIQYGEFVFEFINMNHPVLVVQTEIHKLPNAEKYYLPHHAVAKESTTTKLRAMMSAPSRSTTGGTTSDMIAVGPTLQDQLVCNLLWYWSHTVALSGDISRMYRQIKFNPKDRKFHLFRWRDHPQKKLRCHEVTRMTYGVASNCYNAVRALQMAARRSDLGEEGVVAALRDFYAGDNMTGAASVAKAVTLMLDIIELLQGSKLLIRKWATNESSTTQALPESPRETADAFGVATPEHNEHVLKTLGVRCRPVEDFNSFTVSHVEPGGRTPRKRHPERATWGQSYIVRPHGLALNSDTQAEHFHSANVGTRPHVGSSATGCSQRKFSSLA